MGYVHDTRLHQFIAPSAISKTAGTWTPSVASNLPKEARGRADAAFTLIVPIPLPSHDTALMGAKIASIDVFYGIATAAADDFATVELEKITLPAATASAPTAAAVTTTLDTGHDTAAERLAVAEHKMTVTITTPEFLDDAVACALTMVVDAAATTDFTLYGVRVNYTLRI